MREIEAAELALEDLIRAQMHDRRREEPLPHGQPLRATDLRARRGGRVRRGRAAPGSDRGRGKRQGAAGGERERPGPPPARVGQRAPLQGGRGVRDALPAGRVRDAAGDDPDDRRRGNGRGPADRRRAVPARPEVRAAYDLGRAGPHGEAPLVRAPRTARDLPETAGSPSSGTSPTPLASVTPWPARSGWRSPPAGPISHTSKGTSSSTPTPSRKGRSSRTILRRSRPASKPRSPTWSSGHTWKRAWPTPWVYPSSPSVLPSPTGPSSSDRSWATPGPASSPTRSTTPCAEKAAEPAGEAGIQWTDGALQEVAEVPLFLRGRARRLAEERARRLGSAEVTREIFLESRS